MAVLPDAGTTVRPHSRLGSPRHTRFSRNPIYLVFLLLQLGIALWVNSVWLFLTLLAAVTVMSLVVFRTSMA